MEIAVGAARWVVGRALSPVTDGLLESWAASSELGPNVRTLKLQLLYAQGMLNNARGREVRNPALGHLLLELRHHAYKADDVLDKLEYFRIQDELEGTYETTDDDQSLVGGLVLHAHHTARTVASKLKIPSCSCAVVCHHDKKPKLKFDRVEMSKRMAEIVEQLKPLCAIVSTILLLDTEPLGSIASNSTTSFQGTALNPTRNTTPQIIQHQLFGRDDLKKEVLDGITTTNGKYTANDLTVLSIVGPGGLGKTTFTQHIFQAVKSHLAHVPIWICVSQNNFNASMLAQEIVKQIPEVDNEKKNASDEERIEKRVQSKKFLLVLDDIWTCHEDEWRKLLALFRNGGTKGNMVIVTTRFRKVAEMVTTTDYQIELKRLNDEDCMSFFKTCVFDNQQSWEEHPKLHRVGSDIVKKLKGFPLAVKTVGRLLKNDLTKEHWTRILESREWEHQTSDNDIMPALKLSYNYLHFHLQQCFSHCALFPEDYKFDRQELIHLWIGLGLLGNDQNNRIEDIGSDYINDLVSHGFFDKEETEDGHTDYVIHDLLHDLAVNVSAYECLSIKLSIARSTQIPSSIRHMSIIIEGTDVQDRTTFENYKRDLYTLGKRLKADNLRTLMLFGDDHGSFCKPINDVFGEAKALRVIFLSGASYDVNDLLHNFSQLIHLRYLRIKGRIFNEKSLSSSISRFYHLLVLDLKQCRSSISASEMSNLVKIRHFAVRDDMCHSGIYKVGKLKSIQELRRFEVKREKHGFELNQLGQLLQLQALGIYNLEKVAVTEVDEANLDKMSHLNRLQLDWGTNESERNTKGEEDVLECLKPPSNLRELCIRGHGGGTYPAWLGTDHIVDNLECLRLERVAWKSLPPLGELLMVGEEPPSTAGKIFSNLKILELVNIPSLKKWSSSSPFSHLETLTIKDCSELIELPFTHYTSPQAQKEENINTFPKLRRIWISKCAKLKSVPQIPWSNSLCHATLWEVGTNITEIYYSKNKNASHIDVTFTEDALDRELWNVLAFSNLREINSFSICKCPPVPLRQLQLLVSLKTLRISECSNFLWATEGESSAQFQFPLEVLRVSNCGATGDELAQLISYFPNLSRLDLWDCDKQARGAEETEAAAGGMLPLPLHLKDLFIHSCPDVRLCSRSLQNQTTLRSLGIHRCPKILSSNSCSASYCPFPTSLRNLSLRDVEAGMFTLTPLSNLTELFLIKCGSLRSEDIWDLLAQGGLEQLGTDGLPNLFDCSVASRAMQMLEADGESGNTAAPIRGRFSSSLTELHFEYSDMVHFTREQSEALQLLTSLQVLRIGECRSLQSLPAGLTGLPNLKKLMIRDCDSIRSLPKGGLPSSLVILEILFCRAFQSLPKGTLPRSLEELKIHYCHSIRSLPKGCLPSSLVILEIWFCPAFQSLPKGTLPRSLEELMIYNCDSIRSLPKGCLPSSLKTLNVRDSNEKLKRQCRKLKGTIPIVMTDY